MIFGFSIVSAVVKAISEKHPLFTIGHSNHSFERFAELIALHDIELIVDVRSFPRSRLPWFSRGEIEGHLHGVNVGYDFLGQELGGRGWERADGSAMALEEIVGTRRFQSGLNRLQSFIRRSQTCIMCAEAEAAVCHRNRLIAPSMAGFAEIFHITANGTLQRYSIAQMQLTLL